MSCFYGSLCTLNNVVPATFVDFTKFYTAIKQDNYTLYHEILLKYIWKWQNYAVPTKTTPHFLAFHLPRRAISELSRVHWEKCMAMHQNSPESNSLDHHIWASMLEKYHKFQPKAMQDDRWVDSRPVDHLWRAATRALYTAVVTSSSAWLPAWLCLPMVVTQSEHLQ